VISILRVLSAIAALARLANFALLVPIPVALAYEPWVPHPNLAGIHLPGSVLVFATAAILVALFWVPARFFTRRLAESDLPDREAYVAVAVGWLVVAAFAMLPFLLSQAIPNPVEAYFEAMSGLTGTGSSVLHDASGMAPSLLFWRAFTQWLGGLGIIVLTVALLSKLTHGGLQLFRSEVAGQAPTRIQPRLAELARDLWRIYLAFTLLFIVVLAALLHFHVGRPPQEAFLSAMTDTFSAYGNGAFFRHAESVAVYGSAWVEGLLSVMMLAGATNFTLVFLLLRRGRLRPLLQDPELRFFYAIVAIAIVAVAASLWRFSPMYADEPLAAARHGAFAAISAATGTGLANADASLWPAATTAMLLLLILVGGTAGSAAGGVKAFRALVLFRTVRRELRRLPHPRAIIPVRVGGRTVAEDTVTAVVAFFFTYLTAWVAGTLLLSLFQPGFSLDEAAGASLAALGNVGASFGPVHEGGYGDLHWYSQVLLSGLMWIGRMEIFAALLLFTPSTWRD
jgi:trk system potassium uptake protein